MAQLAAMAAARPLDRVAVHSPNPEHRRAFVDQVRAEGWPMEVHEADTVADAVRDAQIVTTATRARTPFLSTHHLLTGTLVNAIGAITPERAELTADLVALADLIVADSPDAAARLASELTGRRATALHEIVATGDARPPEGLTIFKAMGIGLADLAIARVRPRPFDRGRQRREHCPTAAGPATAAQDARHLEGGAPR